MGVPQNDTTRIARYDIDGYWQYFVKSDGSYLDIYAPEEKYESYHVTGELKDAINELGGTDKLGFIKDIKGFR